MSRHVSAENLALYREEVLSRRKMARIKAHLAGCDRCAATGSELAAVTGMLAHSSAPPMPDLLAERIQLALAGEAAARAEASAHAEAVSIEPGAGPAGTGLEAPAAVPGRPDLPERARSRARRPRMPGLTSPLVLRALAATGAVAAVAGVGFLLANNSQPPTAGTAAGSGTRSAAAPSMHNPAASGIPTRFSVHYRRNGSSATAGVLTTNINFTRQSIGREARRQIALTPSMATGPPAAPAGQASPAATARGQAAAVNAEKLGTCLTVVAAGRRVLIVEVAEYLGKPAVIIIMRPLRPIDVLDVAVVGLACSASDTHPIASFQVPAS